MPTNPPNIPQKRFPVGFFLIFLLLTCMISAAGYYFYHILKKNISQSKCHELSAIADLKVNLIRIWRNERMNDAEFLRGSPIFVDYVEQFLLNPLAERKKKVAQRLITMMQHRDYENIYLVDSRRKERLAIKKGKNNLNNYDPSLVAQAMMHGNILFSDLIYGGSSGAIHIDLIVPLVSTNKQNAPAIGAVIFQIDPGQFLYPTILAWPTPSTSGETLLVRRDGEDIVYLNELRYRKNTALTLRFPITTADLMAAMAVRGHVGIVEGVDYRGTAVLAATQPITGTGWFIISKIDTEEVYAPIREHALKIGCIIIILISAATAAVGFMWHRDNVAYYRSLSESEAKRLEELQNEERLRKVNALLTRSNKELEQFAYIASHDLQEPLRMVGSYLQLLAQRYQGKLDHNADEFIGYAVDGAVRMQRMINDLLIVSRIGSKGQPFKEVDCNSILSQVLADLKLAIEETGARITADPLPVVTGDASQLAQVFQNLISNSIKFHGESTPEIHIHAERNENEWQFFVRDNGIGLDPAYVEKIFIIFQRLHPAARYPGSGIGLTICKKIIERHGGRIWAESENGKGAAFYFTIPLKPREE